jgi:flagellar basal body-associated protein FliL
MKGVTGGLLWTILVIIIGIVALALFWLFLTGLGESVEDLFNKLVLGFKEMIKSLLPSWLRWLF